jgi:hypothetical protein
MKFFGGRRRDVLSVTVREPRSCRLRDDSTIEIVTLSGQHSYRNETKNFEGGQNLSKCSQTPSDRF